MFTDSGAPSSRSMLTSLAVHIAVLVLLMLVPAQVLLHSEPPDRDLDIVFYRPPEVKIAPSNAVVPAVPKGPAAAGLPAGAPAPAVRPRPDLPPGPEGPGNPELPAGPGESVAVEPQPAPREKVGKAGILAFKDKFASLSQQDKVAPRLGADARYAAADEVGRPSSRSGLTTTTPGGSGGINVASLNRSVGGGGGGGGGGRGGGGRGGTGTGGSGGGGGSGGDGNMPLTRATSAITAIGGNDRPKARGGVGASRTDEEIQIVFDRYKSAFYRLYNRELRNNPTLQGQIVLRLTIEPDGSVSMCTLASTDMDAPALVEQVISRVKTINFGAKEVQAVTIVYPIDFLPAA
ncbi:MAG TPA: AgmX/PglI C-terminal domain-containing protein [Terriglobia bacterium]|nr:AgmX/PglI C-terminal domain-containing protein [Terriglobia bacterium]